MNNKILRLPAVKEISGYSTSNIYRMMDNGSFPNNIKLGGRAVGWLEKDIDEWLNDRIAESKNLSRPLKKEGK